MGKHTQELKALRSFQGKVKAERYRLKDRSGGGEGNASSSFTSFRMTAETCNSKSNHENNGNGSISWRLTFPS
jgi:hypothetical protein